MSRNIRFSLFVAQDLISRRRLRQHAGGTRRGKQREVTVRVCTVCVTHRIKTRPKRPTQGFQDYVDAIAFLLFVVSHRTVEFFLIAGIAESLIRSGNKKGDEPSLLSKERCLLRKRALLTAASTWDLTRGRHFFG